MPDQQRKTVNDRQPLIATVRYDMSASDVQCRVHSVCCTCTSVTVHFPLLHPIHRISYNQVTRKLRVQLLFSKDIESCLLSWQS